MEGPGLGIATRWCGRGDRDRALDQRAVYRPGKKGPYRAPASGDGFELVKIAHRRSHASIPHRSEEHTSELQSLMRISYAVFCLQKKKEITKHQHTINNKQYAR